MRRTSVLLVGFVFVCVFANVFGQKNGKPIPNADDSLQIKKTTDISQVLFNALAADATRVETNTFIPPTRFALQAATAFQDFGTETGSVGSGSSSTTLLPNPVGSGTTWARVGTGSGSINLVNTSNPLGTTGSYVRAVAPTATSVNKFSPWVSYTGGKEFYTSFKILFGDSSAGNTATSGTWSFYQGGGTMFSDANNFSGNQVFTGLNFAFGTGGAISLTYRGGTSNITTGLTTSSLASGTVYTIEIVGNNKSSGTINYVYNGTSESVAVQKFDLYLNGTLIGDDLSEAALGPNSDIYGGTFIGVSSTSNVANIFVDDAVTYNAVPANIGAPVNTAPVLDASKSPALADELEGSGLPGGVVGTLVSQLTDLTIPAGGLDNVTDPDSGAVTGIAVTGANSTNGAWFYSIDNGANWSSLGSVGNGNARLLAADANTRLYFQPLPGFNGTIPDAITFRAWDQTSGTNGSLADTTTNGGTTAFSTLSDTASINVLDTVPPETTILTGPASVTYQETQATFTFSSSEAGSTFECKLDGGAWSACASPTTVSGFTMDVSHTFAVRATDAAGNTDATPATWTWTPSSNPAPGPPQMWVGGGSFGQIEGRDAEIPVERGGDNTDITGTSTVDYSVSALADDTANGGTCGTGDADFAASTGTLTFAPNETEKFIVVHLCDDRLSEDPAEVFSVSLSNPVNGSIGDVSSAQVTILDVATQFASNEQITMPDNAPSTPYGTQVNVSGLTGTVTGVRLTLFDVERATSNDFAVMLVDPSGTKSFVAMANTGGTNPMPFGVITLEDNAATMLPEFDPVFNGHNYKPTDCASSVTFPSPAPQEPSTAGCTEPAATFASTFAGSNPNGNWTLYVIDMQDTALRGRSIAANAGDSIGGWGIQLTTSVVTAAPVSINGRVRTANGTGIPNAIVTVSGGPETVLARTNGFGFYQINGLEPGKTYFLTASARTHSFSPQAVSLYDNLSGFDLVADR